MTVGFLVIDKASGMTSHDVVARVRRATGIKKSGHAGTLDPMATGVVVVALGRATRLIRFVQDQEKEYLATATFGVATDTLDADGEVVGRVAMSLTAEDLDGVRPRFVGEIDQVPPMVSALKKDGRRLYDLAREGVDVDRQPRIVVVHELEILSVGAGDHPVVSFRVVCGKGTYVRSLADDMARALGGFAHLTALRRIRIGALTVEAALPVEDLEGWRQHLLAPSEVLEHMPAMTVEEEAARAIGHGRELPTTSGLVGPIRVLDETGRLLAVYDSDGRTARPMVVIA